MTVEEREEALTAVAAEVDLLDFAIQLARLAYYSSPITAAHLGYPGANPGYWRDENFSFDRPMATEITEDGNHP